MTVSGLRVMWRRLRLASVQVSVSVRIIPSSRLLPMIFRKASSSVATFWENSAGSIRASRSPAKMPAISATVPSVVIVSVAPSPSRQA